MLGRLRAASLAANPAEHRANEADTAGRDAEQSITHGINAGRAFFGESRVWHAVRVPAESGGRREIDILVLNPLGLHVIEVKRWGGTVSVGRGGEWTQHRHNGAQVRHGQVLAALHEKRDALLHYLRGCDGLSRNIHVKLLFTGGVELPAEVTALAEVARCGEVDEYLRTLAEGAFTNLARHILPSMLSGRRLSAAELQSAAVALDELGTWDVLTLTGGRVVTGDAQRLSTGPTLGPQLRAQASELRFSHRRSLIAGGVSAVMGYEPQVNITPVPRASGERLSQPAVGVPIDSTLEFREAGDRKLTSFVVNEVEGLVLSGEDPASSDCLRRAVALRPKLHSGLPGWLPLALPRLPLASKWSAKDNVCIHRHHTYVTCV